jgi:hypothetical protein
MSADQPKLSEIEANIRQEIGVMVGFMAVFALVIITFAVVWRMKNKRQAVVEEQRQRELHEKGFGMRGGLRGDREKGVRDLAGGEPLLEQGAQVEQRERL